MYTRIPKYTISKCVMPHTQHICKFVMFIER